MNQTMKTILSRRSVRRYTEEDIPDETLKQILTAGMAGPSSVNAKEWQFIVVRNKETLLKMAEINGRPADPLKRANVGVLICGDLKRAFSEAPEYWIIDCAIAGQNMSLAAQSLGIGAVWLGTWPRMDRVKKQAELFHLPDSLVPHSILAFGYPAKDKSEIKDCYHEEWVHWETWKPRQK